MKILFASQWIDSRVRVEEQLKSEEAMPLVSQSLSQEVRAQIIRDMRPSVFTLCNKTAFAFSVGGVLSLFICGELGVGIVHAQFHFQSLAHVHRQGMGSALICGALFALISSLVLRLICTSIQFRVITKKSRFIAPLWLIALGSILAHYGVMESRFSPFALWCILAWLTLEGLSRLIDWIETRGVYTSLLFNLRKSRESF